MRKSVITFSFLLLIVIVAGCNSKEEISREEYTEYISEELAYLSYADDYYSDLLHIQDETFEDFYSENDKLMKLQETYNENMNTLQNRLDHTQRFYETYEIPEEFREVPQDFQSVYSQTIEVMEGIEVNTLDWNTSNIREDARTDVIVDEKLNIIDSFYFKGIRADEQVEEELWCRFAVSCSN
ncbi:hypothetical protein [Salinicoccus luteus]|uniref:hypothetical protein n=1 Tax=Salinicoccus luteus TaxID=367840 RepID=UPI0004E116BC|nr:hypothetical protein [Salinicoccus luteus]